MKMKTVLKLAGITVLGYSVFTAGRVYEVIHLTKKAYNFAKKIWNTPISKEVEEKCVETKSDDICEKHETIKLELDFDTYKALMKAIEEAK